VSRPDLEKQKTEVKIQKTQGLAWGYFGLILQRKELGAKSGGKRSYQFSVFSLPKENQVGTLFGCQRTRGGEDGKCVFCHPITSG
jgi:hypothetical protein